MLAVGFDLGETLIFYSGIGLSWEDRYPAAIQAVGEACNITIDEKKVHEACKILRKYNTRDTPRIEEVLCENIFSEIFSLWGIENGLSPEEAISAFFGYFQGKAEVYPDTVACLQAIREMGVPIGVLTDVPYGMNHRFVYEDLRRAGIEKLVDVVITSVEVGMRKPHKSGFEMLATVLDVSPKEMLFVGNESKDIEGANATSMQSVLLDRDGKTSQFGQKATINELTELVPMIQSRL